MLLPVPLNGALQTQCGAKLLSQNRIASACGGGNFCGALFVMYAAKKT